jgi:hypothetical protein
MHPKLLFDVIQRQAGTLAKAVLECVMNSVDAGASKIKVGASRDEVNITDDGRGFTSREEIEKWFETFGQPHTASENKRFGTFRMGRGQAFSFGRNQWRTGKFFMDVDIKHKGLDYDLTETKKYQPGCAIDIALYAPLASLGLRCLEDDLKAMVQWLNVPVTFNGQLLSRDPAIADWTAEDADAYYKFTTSGSMDVYNLGVRVKDYGSYNLGVGGVVVSKKQLKLNFARNDVMSDCPVWQRIRKVVNDRAGNSAKTKKKLTDDQIVWVSKQIAAGELTGRDATTAAVFTDVTGRNWSLDSIRRKSHDLRNTYTVAPLEDQKGDNLMQHKIAFVFARECLDRFGSATLAELFEKVIKPLYPYGIAFEIADFDSLAIAIDDRAVPIPPAEWTEIEKAVVMAIESAYRQLRRERSDESPVRKVLIGDSDVAAAWTDGESYVAFSRQCLRSAGTDLRGWVIIGNTLLHELCHGDPDSGTHSHTPEFYREFHDQSDFVAAFAPTAMNAYTSAIKSAGRRLTRRQLAALDAEAQRLEAEGKLAAAAA